MTTPPRLMLEPGADAFGRLSPHAESPACGASGCVPVDVPLPETPARPALRPCGFCGHAGPHGVVENPLRHMATQCLGCGARGPLSSAEGTYLARVDEAATRWNTRTPLPESPSVLMDLLVRRIPGVPEESPIPADAPSAQQTRILRGRCLNCGQEHLPLQDNGYCPDCSRQFTQWGLPNTIGTDGVLSHSVDHYARLREAALAVVAAWPRITEQDMMRLQIAVWCVPRTPTVVEREEAP